MNNRTCLGLAAEAVRLVIEAKPIHRKKGNFLASVTDKVVIDHVIAEACELSQSLENGHPDIDEMADTLISLFHLCIRQQWDHGAVAVRMIAKMKLRFDLLPDLIAKLEALEKQIHESANKESGGT